MFENFSVLEKIPAEHWRGSLENKNDHHFLSSYHVPGTELSELCALFKANASQLSSKVDGIIPISQMGKQRLMVGLMPQSR